TVWKIFGARGSDPGLVLERLACLAQQDRVLESRAGRESRARSSLGTSVGTSQGGFCDPTCHTCMLPQTVVEGIKISPHITQTENKKHNVGSIPGYIFLKLGSQVALFNFISESSLNSSVDSRMSLWT
uniref:Uncharacterized protein n=1 Tax=Gopherus agassizii TaxID=38772 RepID=A0A452H184_9SAUR